MPIDRVHCFIAKIQTQNNSPWAQGAYSLPYEILNWNFLIPASRTSYMTVTISHSLCKHGTGLRYHLCILFGLFWNCFIAPYCSGAPYQVARNHVCVTFICRERGIEYCFCYVTIMWPEYCVGLNHTYPVYTIMPSPTAISGHYGWILKPWRANYQFCM